jgi:hypothetical protein
MVAKGGMECIVGEKGLWCDIYVEDRRVANIHDLCGAETTWGRGSGRARRRAYTDNLLCLAFGLAKVEKGHAPGPGRDVEGKNGAPSEGR